MKSTLPLLALAGILAQPLFSARAKEPAAPEAKHVVVYHNPAEFAGWPANEGMWAWGDEMLVGFEVAKYVETEGDHSIDRDAPKRIVFARSLDGGLTWKAEEHPEIGVPEYLGDPEKHKQHRAGEKEPVPSPGGFDFTHPDFALKSRGGTFYTSTDRGRTWAGPYIIPSFGYSPELRTSYIVTGKQSCVFFITGRVTEAGVSYARSGAVQTTDGGKTFEFLGWIGNEVGDELRDRKSAAGKEGDAKMEAGNENIFAIMPSAVQLGEGRFIVALRQRINKKKWSSIYETTDGCKTWKRLGTLENGSSNPVTLVKLEGETVAAVYGNRRKRPLGVSAKISRDGGKTWGDELMLRGDARTWDLGYSRAVLRPDGTIVAAYYYNTEAHRQNHIAATLWKPLLKAAEAEASSR